MKTNDNGKLSPANTSFATRSPTLITLLHAICQIPQLTEPDGANGKESHQVNGPSHPGGRKNTADLRYHHPTTNWRPVVLIQIPELNFSEKLVLLEASSPSICGVYFISRTRNRTIDNTYSVSPNPPTPYLHSSSALPTSQSDLGHSFVVAPSS